jgi:hypothetical protein
MTMSTRLQVPMLIIMRKNITMTITVTIIIRTSCPPMA